MIANVTCQHCGKPFESALSDKTEFCPHCGRETVILAAGPTIPPGAVEAGRLRDHARWIHMLAILALVLAPVVVIITYAVYGNSSGESYAARWADAWIVVGSLCATSFWLFFVAQVVHIRANTLK